MNLDISQVKVIYEDNHLIAVNKPGGWLVHGDKTKDTPLSEYVKEFIKIRYKKPGKVFLGVIHRLDRPVSGVLVFAKTSKALTRMNKLFQDREMTKVYHAITHKCPEELEGTLIHYMKKDKRKNKSFVYEQGSRRADGVKKAELSYKMLGRIAGHYLFEIHPITGRPHQIRVQMSEVGCPIYGDLKYGFSHAAQDSNIYLHCSELSFIHPVKKEKVTIKAPLPDDQIWALFDQN